MAMHLLTTREVQTATADLWTASRDIASELSESNRSHC